MPDRIEEMGGSSGRRLAWEQRGLVLGAIFAVAVWLVVAVATGEYLRLAPLLAVVVLLTPTLLVLQRNHNQRRTSAEASGAFGATCNVYFHNVRDLPRFQPILGHFRMPVWTKLPSTMSPLQRSVMGGVVRIDAAGIVWTPSAYRQKKGMPTLRVPLEEVESVTRRPMLAVGRGGALEVRLREGGEWLLTMQDSDQAIRRLAQLGCRTVDP